MNVSLTNHHVAIRNVETPERVEFQAVNGKKYARKFSVSPKPIVEIEIFFPCYGLK